MQHEQVSLSVKGFGLEIDAITHTQIVLLLFYIDILLLCHFFFLLWYFFYSGISFILVFVLLWCFFYSSVSLSFTLISCCRIFTLIISGRLQGVSTCLTLSSYSDQTLGTALPGPAWHEHVSLSVEGCRLEIDAITSTQTHKYRKARIGWPQLL